jgi:ADP-dependent NAD(P)H-hydrate dehydratase
MTAIMAETLRALPIPAPGEGGDKDARGRVLVAGGSRQVPGGAVLAAEAALRAGAGRLRVATGREIAVPMAFRLPEARVIDLPETDAGDIAPSAAAKLANAAMQVDSLLLGPGMMDANAAAALVQGVLARMDPQRAPQLALDAGALCGQDVLREALRPYAGRAVLTPHAGEMASILGVGRDAVEADPIGTGRHAAALLQAVVVMKGARTHVVSPAGDAWSYTGGSVGLATSGSGDVLAGLLAGLLARGAPPVSAAVWAVWLHGEAGASLAQRIGPIGFLARELAAEIPRLMAQAA